MLEKALELARNNQIHGLPPMAAVLYKRNRIIATGINSWKSHPLMGRYSDIDGKHYLHAEIDCIKNALKLVDKKEIKGAEIFVARVLKNGETAIAKPCKICQKALSDFGITGIYWTEYE